MLDKPYDLDQLLEEVVKEHFQGDRSKVKSIQWTNYPIANKYFAFTRMVDGSIEVNSLLNSSQIPRDTVKSVVYHECLHAIKGMNHGEEFQKLEQQFPDYYKHNYFLSHVLQYKYYTITHFE